MSQRTVFIGGWSYSSKMLENNLAPSLRERLDEIISIDELDLSNFVSSLSARLEGGDKIIAWSMGSMLLLEALAEGVVSADEICLVSSCMRFVNSDTDSSFIKLMQRDLQRESYKSIRAFQEKAASPKSLDEEFFQEYSEDRIQKLTNDIAGLDYLLNFNLNDCPANLAKNISIIHGEKDSIIDVQHAQELAKKTGVSNFFVVPDAGHNIVFDEVIGEYC